MKKFFVGAFAIIAVAIMYSLTMPDPAPSRTVSVNGECTVKVRRDKYGISLRTSAVRKNAAESLRAAQNAADGIVRKIRALGDPSVEIQTKNIWSYEKTKWENNSQKSLGTETQITLSVVTDNANTIDLILVSLADIKDAEVFPENLNNFSSTAVIKDATAKCLAGAISDARAKAQAIAVGDGEQLGRLMSAEYWGGRGDSIEPRPMMELAKAARSMADTGGGEYIQSTDGELSVGVRATFRLR